MFGICYSLGDLFLHCLKVVLMAIVTVELRLSSLSATLAETQQVRVQPATHMYIKYNFRINIKVYYSSIVLDLTISFII
jgi:hypothetical protein